MRSGDWSSDVGSSDRDMGQGMAEAVRSFEQDSDIRVIVVSGAGDQAFSAGADTSEFEEKRGTEAAVRRYEEVVEAAIHALTQTPKPTLAMIQIGRAHV